MSRERRTLVVLFLVALAVRLAWVLSVSRDGLAKNDSLFYHLVAYNIGHGGVYGSPYGVPTARWPPGWPSMLAVLYRVFGYHTVVGEVFNAFLGAVTVPLLHRLVKPHFGTRVALIAAGMLAVMPGPILWTDLLVTETVFTLLLVVFFLLVMRASPTWKWAAALGLYVGLVAMVRSEAIIWMAVPLVLWWRQAGWRVAVPRMAAAGAVFLLALVPWAVRNTQAMGAFVPLSTNAGETLYAGHNPNANGMQNHPSDELSATFGTPGTPEWEVAWSKGLQREAVSWAVHHPVGELKLIPKKILALNRGDSWAFEWLNMEPYPTLGTMWTTYLSVVADFAWFTLLALTLIGAVALGRATWRHPLMTSIAAMFGTLLVMYGVVYYGNYRYRLPYEPLMMVVAALVVDRGWQGLRAARETLSAAPAIEMLPEPDADGTGTAAGAEAGDDAPPPADTDAQPADA